jgi:hypothetical protein
MLAADRIASGWVRLGRSRERAAIFESGES